MRKGKKTYDLIASLGGDCSAASQLRLRGLRHEAYPFDWTYIGSEWRLLDEVELRGVAHARPKGLAKAVYKVWKHLGKWLNKRGYKT